MSFALYLDEHVDITLAALLREGGCDVVTTQEAGRANQRVSDEDQLAFAASQGRALVTHNVKDFVPLASMWSEQSKHHAGIIVSELRPLAS